MRTPGILFTKYAYVLNSPVSLVDPLGRKACCSFSFGVAASAAVAIGGMFGGVQYSCKDDCGNTKKGSAFYGCYCTGAGASAGFSLGPTKCCGPSFDALVGSGSEFTITSVSIGVVGVGYTEDCEGTPNSLSGGLGLGVGVFSCVCNYY